MPKVSDMTSEELARLIDERFKIAVDDLVKHGESVGRAFLLQQVNQLREEIRTTNERLDKAAKVFDHLKNAVSEHDQWLHSMRHQAAPAEISKDLGSG